MFGTFIGMVIVIFLTLIIGRFIFKKFNRDLTLKDQYNDTFVQPFDDLYISRATKNIDEEWKKFSMKDIGN